MSINFLVNHFDKVSYLQNLLAARATGNVADPAEYLQLRHQLLKDPEIGHRLPPFVRQHGNLDSFWTFIKGKFSSYAERRAYLSEQFTPLLDSLEFPNHNINLQQQAPGTDQKIPTMKASSPAPVIARNKRKIFIVHGRDDLAKLEVSRFVEKLGLEAIILHEQANAGMTIIEKIERYTNDADFALVLYTPCDQGIGNHEQQEKLRDRARQNVVFEHGYLMAKLGRENVCALVKGTIETPNDISGVVYVNLDQAGAWKRDIVNELRACGYTISNW
ncbi:putative nucleotide-binding protein containing TIR-like domain protein [Pseudomonas sp. 37 R 15]|uniref:TIR domain-containing protein n=1 Tax=Pseudomonas sp. 37 R 15 TaxID=1844104 RepID=UPI00081254B0|nr:nucleotide-binding protein [Pseudomonas sp. 37 R 15]CRM31151.1 putative nucleotide-binding protein containing TIR-like domain protein [Pseudomonas sp. 37 R 15]